MKVMIWNLRWQRTNRKTTSVLTQNITNKTILQITLVTTPKLHVRTRHHCLRSMGFWVHVAQPRPRRTATGSVVQTTQYNEWIESNNRFLMTVKYLFVNAWRVVSTQVDLFDSIYRIVTWFYFDSILTNGQVLVVFQNVIEGLTLVCFSALDWFYLILFTYSQASQVPVIYFWFYSKSVK